MSYVLAELAFRMGVCLCVWGGGGARRLLGNIWVERLAFGRSPDAPSALHQAEGANMYTPYVLLQWMCSIRKCLTFLINLCFFRQYLYAFI